MSRKAWIVVLIAGGVGLAILIGVLGTRNEPSTTKAQAVTSLCGSLSGLQSSLKTLTSLDPSTATKDELNTDVTAVQNSWTAGDGCGPGRPEREHGVAGQRLE
jgi:hypothetical protein